MEAAAVIVLEEEWGAAADDACAFVRNPSKPGADDAAALKAEYDHGHVHVWGFYLDGARIGTALVEFLRFPDGQCLAVHVAHGSAKGVDLCATLLPGFEQIAKGRGCRWISFETMRDGLKAKARGAGYQERSFFVKGLD